MKHLMQTNGWIIKPSEKNDTQISIYPVNRDKDHFVTVKAEEYHTIASLTVGDSECKDLGVKDEVTLFHREEVDLKITGEPCFECTGKKDCDIEEWQDCQYNPHNKETETYMVFWFYQANYGWQSIDAVDPHQACKLSRYGEREEVMKVTVRFADFFHENMISSGMNLAKNKTVQRLSALG